MPSFPNFENKRKWEAIADGDRKDPDNVMTRMKIYVIIDDDIRYRIMVGSVS